MDTQITRVTDPADPTRCKAAAPTGQCMNQAERGADYCIAHNGGRGTALAQDKRTYHLTTLRDRTRLAELADSDSVKSLRDEIGLARMLIERRFNLIREDKDLLLHSGEIHRMLLTVERLVKSADSIEQKLGVQLSRETALRITKDIIEAVIDELQDLPDFDARIDRIYSRCIPVVAKATNQEQRPGQKRLPPPNPQV